MMSWTTHLNNEPIGLSALCLTHEYSNLDKGKGALAALFVLKSGAHKGDDESFHEYVGAVNSNRKVIHFL